MDKPKSVIESSADLRRLGGSFRSLISYSGDDAVKHWHRFRGMGDVILNDIWLETCLSPRSAFDAIEGFRNQDLSAWPRSSCDHNRFFKKLVGFEFEPRYRSFMVKWPYLFEDGSRLTRELCFSGGLIHQPVIAVDPELANDPERLWPLHRFELLDRCANGCEMIAEIVEREMATTQAPQRADNQADDGNQTKTALSEAALKAVIDGGLASVMSQANRIPAKQRHSETIVSMLKSDARYYEWSLDEWASYLKGSKKTIRDTEGWRRIMQYRAKSKQDRLVE